MAQTISLSSLERAIRSLEKAVSIDLVGVDDPLQNELYRDATIQRFEYTQELCVKFIRRVLLNAFSQTDVDELTYRDLMRVAFERGLIADPLPWFDAREARNKTSHAYDEKIATEVYLAASHFLPQAQEFLARLHKLYASD